MLREPNHQCFQLFAHRLRVQVGLDEHQHAASENVDLDAAYVRALEQLGTQRTAQVACPIERRHCKALPPERRRAERRAKRCVVVV